MGATAQTFETSGQAGVNQAWLARLTRDDGAGNLVNVVQADLAALAALAYAVTDSSGAAVASGALVVASCVHDTLQLTTAWTVDGTGWNARLPVPGTAFPLAGRRYTVVFTVTLNDGSSYPVVFSHFTT